MKKIILFIALCIISLQLSAQSKIGTIDSEFIMSKMPELSQVETGLKTYNTKLEAELKTKATEYETKIKAYQEKEASMTDADKKKSQEEFIMLENDINSARQNASKASQAEQSRLIKPLYEKIGKAIEEVAKAGQYTQILTVANSGLAYIDPKFDITKVVLTKLGIKVE